VWRVAGQPNCRSQTVVGYTQASDYMSRTSEKTLLTLEWLMDETIFTGLYCLQPIDIDAEYVYLL